MCEAPALFCYSWKPAFIECDKSVAETITDNPARPIEMRPPARFGVAVGDIEAHERGCGVLPVAARVVRLEQGRIERKMAAIIVDDPTSRWCQPIRDFHSAPFLQYLHHNE